MSFLETIESVRAFLERNRRVSLSVLKREFDLDEDALQQLVDELVDVQQVAAHEGKVLSWVGTAAAREPETSEGERRQLTVLFCDLVGSTELASRLDPEDWREIVRQYQQTCSDVIEGFEGHVAQYLGDGLLVYFGYPQAHEDDAERAVRAGRGIVGAIAESNAALEKRRGPRLAVRIGIHTGPVVVGEMGGGEKKETLALGDAPNVAARLEGIAEPDTVVISDATLRLVAGLFVTEDRGTPELKGISESIRVYWVGQPSGVTSRLDRAPTLTPFVGRDQELGLLLDRFEQTRERRGQAVLISGEAGIGKSRLVHQLRVRLRETPHTWLECGMSRYAQSSAFYPLIELIGHAAGFRDTDSPEDKLGRLERGLTLAGLELEEAVPLFAGLLSLRLPEHSAPLEISPQLQRQKTLEALIAWLLALAEKQPVVLLVEDLHWADPSTLEWLGLLIEQSATAGVLLLLSFRPDFEPPWPARAHVSPIGLSRLRQRQTIGLIAGAIPGTVLPEALVDEIASRSDGVPLFIEELAKGVVESAAGLGHSPSKLAIPETIQDSLMERLDRLGNAKQVAQLGAALGREFPFGLVKAVARLKDVALREGLGRLVEAELLYQQGLPPEATYTFKHALVQDTAYQSMLKSRRRELHGRIADALEGQFAHRIALEPETIARHCEEAGRTPRAITHYRRAGELAADRFAHTEAIGHLQRAIELLRGLPVSSERNEEELQLHVALGAALTTARGYADPEVERVFERARALCAHVGEKPELVRVVIGLSAFHQYRGEFRTATELAEQALAVAQQTGETFAILAAHARLGNTFVVRGEFRRALEHCERAIDLYNPSDHRSLASAWGQDWGISARSFAATTLNTLGHPDRARRLSRETVELARAGDPHRLASALVTAAGLHHDLRERKQARERAEETIAIARERGFTLMLGMSSVFRGHAVGGSVGLEEVERGLGLIVEAKAVGWLARCQCVLSGLYLELGRTDDALAALEAAVASHGETGFDLQKVRAEILVQQGFAEEAEGCLRRALEIARSQEAKFFELRAATSLSRLLRDRGRGEEARALLQPVYDWFTEGFDTQDLKDAKALLEELG